MIADKRFALSESASAAAGAIQKIAQVMQHQVPDQALKAAADDIIDNNGELDAIAPQVRALHRNYLELAGQAM